jgi:hypothetical protein
MSIFVWHCTEKKTALNPTLSLYIVHILRKFINHKFYTIIKMLNYTVVCIQI